LHDRHKLNIFYQELHRRVLDFDHSVKCGLKMVVIRQTLSQIRSLLVRTIRTMMHERDSVHVLRPDDRPELDGGDDDDMEILVVEHLGIGKLVNYYTNDTVA